MSAWPRDEKQSPGSCPTDLLSLLGRAERPPAAEVTQEGAAWLASATPSPYSALAAWQARPEAPGVLPCGAVFDVVNLPTVFARRVLDRLWSEGPGTGPVATHRGRVLLFAAPGTAQRLPALIGWEEWGGTDRTGGVPPLLCHGAGDAVTVPPLAPGPPSGPRWVVAPDTRGPWLPGPEVLLWACVGAARAGARPGEDRAVPAARRRPASSSALIDFSSRGSGC
ncbi:bifunctional DNA primase/polymerase [Streptomyces fuscigenes]|uniref:bifunctional DNA primase/polymerase n=1 Tax=Streptomyces fuscigenes TaxID=1528880 RepID=UPI00355788B1